MTSSLGGRSASRWVLKGIGKCQEGYELTYDTPDGVAKVTPPHTPFTTR